MPLFKVGSINNGTTILNHIIGIVEQYIADHNLENKSLSTLPSKYFYATIPSDMKRYRQSIGNIIRALDMIAEKQLNLRCHLHPYFSDKLLSLTDYYFALFNDGVNKKEANEFKLAVDSIDDPNERLSALTAFKLQKGKILSSNHEVSRLLKDREIFAVTINSTTDRVFLKLLLWIYSTNILYIDAHDPNISISRGKICFFGNPVADIASIDANHEMRDLLEQRKQTVERIKQITSTTDLDKANRLYVLSSQINAITGRLMQLVVLELNNILYNPAQYNVDETQNLDVETILSTIAIESRTLTTLVEHCSDNWNTAQKHIYDRIEYLRQHIEDNEDRKEITQLLRGRNQILQQAYTHSFISASDLMDSLLYSVGIVDTCIEGNIPFDEDPLYDQIVKLSDAEGITSPIIEMMRLNLGNAYARVGKYDRAIKTYRASINTFRIFDTTQPAIRRYLSHLYMAIVMQSIEYYPHNPELKFWVQEILKLTSGWIQESPSYNIERALALTCYLAEIEFEPYIGKELALEAEGIMDELLQSKVLESDDALYGDVYCYFPNALGWYYLEQHHEVKDADRSTYFKKAAKYLNISLQKSLCLEAENYCEYLTYASNAHHNLGYLYASTDYDRALSHYREALKERKTVFAVTGYQESEKVIAETLINTCWVYVYYCEDRMKQHPVGDIGLPENPIALAEEALSIYKRFYTPGVLGLETRYYTALLLIGNLHYLLSRSSAKTDAEYGMQCLKQCAEWNAANPTNDQHDRISDIVSRFRF